MSGGRFILQHELARKRALAYVADCPAGWVVTVKPPTRSLQANARMWALLTDVSEQVVWHGRRLSPEAWKHVFSSALKKQEVVPNIDGTGFVVLGQSTSQMTVGEMNELQVLIEAFGSQHGVRWSDELAHTKATA
jgi:hypothetical protein